MGQAIAVAVYGLLLAVAATNLFLMRRPGRVQGHRIAALIPARNEADNLAVLVPALIEQGFQVFVADDESSDGTAQVTELGATVIRLGPLPPGWTGKNRACHELAKTAAEASDADSWVFLDADVRPQPGFADALRSLAHRAPVVTGFARLLPGRGIEPLFLAWVSWILLATNPFGLVSRTRMGHNRFTNGQVVMWRATEYTRLWPHEQVKGTLLEDVAIGRLLAHEGVRVEVANLTQVLSVRMYDTWRETMDGMSKNSVEITGSIEGTLALAILLGAFAWLWLLAPWTILLLIGSGFLTALACRGPLWPIAFMPAAVTIGATTMVRSIWWRATGRTAWKGRSYPQ